MYWGEATFYQDRLSKLLQVAKHLKISNIGENFNIPESEEEPPKEDNRTESDEVKLDGNFDVPVSTNETDSEDIKEPVHQITLDTNKTLNGP